MFRVLSGNPFAFVSHRLRTPFLLTLVAAVALALAPVGSAEAGNGAPKSFSSKMHRSYSVRHHGSNRNYSHKGHQGWGNQGKWRNVGIGAGKGRHYDYGKPWRRVKTDYGRRHPAASSGVMLAGPGYGHHGGPKIIHYDSDRRHWTTRYLDAAGSVHIVVDTTNEMDEVDPAERVTLEGGSCADRDYCTLRLGPYSNSPKIITLNETGNTISNAPIR